MGQVLPFTPYVKKNHAWDNSILVLLRMTQRKYTVNDIFGHSDFHEIEN
jgi:hypothetical protein